MRIKSRIGIDLGKARLTWQENQLKNRSDKRYFSLFLEQIMIHDTHSRPTNSA